MRSLAVINAKGGVLKTTTALSIAAGMAMQAKGKRQKPILLVDADPQAHSTLILCEREAESPTLREVLMDEAEALEAIRPTRIKGLDILPAAGDLAACTTLLQDETGRELRLRRALRSIERRYSCAIVDSAPQVTLVTMAILRGVNELIVPVDASLFALSGLGKLRDIVSDVRRLLDHPELTIIGLLLVRARADRQTRDLESQLRQAHGSLVYRTTIPFAPVVDQAHCAYRTVIEWAPTSAVSLAYGKLIGEINHGRKKRRGGRAAKANSAA
jgi:chromosome partitioning protein